MAFFEQAITVLQTLVIALGAGLGIWGVINLLEGYGNDNPGAKSQGMKQLMAGAGVAVVGMVIDGMDVVDEIASQPRNMLTNKPKKPQVMKSVTVDTQGVEYPEPEKLPDPFHS